MLPNVPLAQPVALASCRGGTTFVPDTLFLQIDAESPLNRTDDALITLIHEGIHWRQFQATTFGALCSWLWHSREVNTFTHLSELPEDELRGMLQKRKDDIAILCISRKTGLPKPPLTGADVTKSRAALARMIWYDHTFTDRYFRNASDAPLTPDPPEQIFSGAIADAVIMLPHLHPSWESFEYMDVQRYYTFEHVGRVRGTDGLELTTRDLLESAALANEVLLNSWTREKRFLLTDEAAAGLVPDSGPDVLFGMIHPVSTWGPRDGLDRGVFLAESEKGLPGSYGRALRTMFAFSGLKPERHESWLTALAVIDFALNGPLPPLVLPNRSQPTWTEVYPPARFLRASVAVKRCGDLRPPYGHKEVLELQGRIAQTEGLSNPSELSTTAVFDLATPNFEDILRGDVWDKLLGTEVSYYHFVRWCQQSLWRQRANNSGMLVAPAFWIWKAMSSNMGAAYSHVAGQLGMTSPIRRGADGEIEHSLGSTPAFGTWLAASRAVHYATNDLMIGTGEPDFRGFPPALMQNETFGRRVRASVMEKLRISYDPWTCV